MRQLTDDEEESLNSWSDFLNSDEGKKLLKELQDDMGRQLRLTFARAAQSNWGPSPALPTLPSFRISPTDIDAVGMYEYQEPEVDEQGTFYGYKILHQSGIGLRNEVLLKSPRYPVVWSGGELTADLVPDERHMHGLHFTKRVDHPELKNYVSDWERSVLVKCALSGTVVETEQGFRAEHAQIVGVYINGNWQSYKDYQECTSAHPDSISDQEEIRWRYINYKKPRQSGKGNWITFDFGPNP